MKNIDYIRKASEEELVLFLYFYHGETGSMKKTKALLNTDVSDDTVASIERFIANKSKGGKGYDGKYRYNTNEMLPRQWNRY